MSPPPIALRDGAIDLAAGVVRRGGAVHPLSPQERELLGRLLASPGATIDRYTLADALGRDVDAARTVDFTVRRLRAKLEVDPARPLHLLTVYGLGYRFEPVPASAPAVLAAAEPPPPERPLLAGGWRLDRARRELLPREGPPVPLTDREADVLAALGEADARAVRREELLVRVWETRRRAALRYVDQVVHRLRRKLADPDGEILRTVPGLGYLLERAPIGPAGNVEPPPDRTYGREDLRARVTALLADARVVALVGPPGVGKTRLATEVAVAHGGPAWRVDLSRSRARTPHAVAAAIADTVGLPTAERAGAEEIGWALGEAGPMLLLLDGAEPVVGILAELLAGWRRRAPAARILVTSRIAPRGLPGPCVDVPPLSPTDARALFGERARAAPCAWDPAAHADTIDVLAARLDHLPLALELAAARAGVLTPAQILAQLEERFTLLADPTRGSLRDAVDWSWALLPGVARAALEHLAVFESAFDLDAARALVDGDLVGALETLHRASWLRVEVVDGRARYRLYESTRAFALERLHARGGEAEAFRRHAAWVVARARGPLAEHGVRYRTALALRPDRDELRASAERAPDPEARAWAWLGAACLTLYGLLPPPPDLDANVGLPPELAALVGLARAQLSPTARERREAVETLTALLPAIADARTRGVVAWDIGTSLYELGAGGAAGWLEQSVEALDEAGAADLAAMAMSTLAVVRRSQGDVALAERLLRDGLARAQASGDAFSEAYLRNGLGVHHVIVGPPAEAEAHLERALAAYRALAYPPGVRAALVNLGNVRIHRGDLDGAAAAYREVLDDARRAGRRALQARVSCHLAFVALGRGDLADAEAQARGSLELHRAAGGGRDQGHALGALGMVAQAEGRHAEALALYERARASLAAGDDHLSALYYRALAATAHAEAGALDAAWEALRTVRSERPLAGPAEGIVRAAEALVRYHAGDRVADLPDDPAVPRTFFSRWITGRIPTGPLGAGSHFRDHARGARAPEGEISASPPRTPR